jgi:hypothetical protein
VRHEFTVAVRHQLLVDEFAHPGQMAHDMENIGAKGEALRSEEDHESGVNSGNRESAS